MITGTAPLLQMHGIRKSFSGNEVLHGVDLRVNAGEIHALVGHNGAGKSTLIKVLGGLYGDYAGEIHLDGSPVRFSEPQESLAAGIAVIHQEFALVPEFDAAQNLALGHEPRRQVGLVDHVAIEREGAALLDRFGIAVPAGVPSRLLSVAHQQLTEIAKALSRDARVLVMDEPTSRLTRSERDALFTIIRSLSARGVAVIYISHFLDEVLAIADTVTVLRDGDRVATTPASAVTLKALAEQIVGRAVLAHPPREALVHEPGPVVLQLDDFGQVGRPGNSLAIRSGQVLGLAGLVGSGRSSLLESICGARPNRGVLRVRGEVVRVHSPAVASRRGIVLVPEDRKNKGLVMQRPLAENLVLTALSRRFSRLGLVRRAARRAAVIDAVQRFDVRAHSVEDPVGSLSGGNQQKALIARANTAQPSVLLLDQPTAGVDIGAKSEIYAHIRDLAAQGVACLVASDELDELLLLCDEVAVVRSGTVGRPQDAGTIDEPTLLAQIGSKGVSA